MDKQYTLSFVILMISGAQVHAAALDRTGQSISAFLQDGNYFEASLSAIDADVSGKVRTSYMTAGTDPSTKNMAENSTYYNAALKLQVTPHFSFGLIYDQPYGTDSSYQALPNNTFSTNSNVTSAHVETQNLSFIFGYQPNQNWNFYVAPVYQTIKSTVKLNGRAFDAISGYSFDMKEDSELGWLAGIAYQIPEIALKAAVTYRSEIKHQVMATESFSPLLSPIVPIIGTGETEVTTPQSINLDLQSGITPSTLIFLNTRWVNWKDFKIKPYQFGKVTEFATQYPTGLNLADYSKDQITVDFGLAQKFNNQWSGVVSAGWDSGAGNPASLLGPVEGYWSAGIGLQFNPAPNYFIQGGVKYFWLGDTAGHSAAYLLPGNAEHAVVADYSDNSAIAYMLKIGYKF
ncbi:transporter [Acinetobacter baumannii]|nr:transporter [Acinetobacter baumannii]